MTINCLNFAESRHVMYISGVDRYLIAYLFMTVTIVVIIVKAAVFLIIHTADFNSLEILIAGY